MATPAPDMGIYLGSEIITLSRHIAKRGYQGGTTLDKKKTRAILATFLFSMTLLVPFCTGSVGAVPTGWTSDVIATGVFGQPHGAYDSHGHLHLVAEKYGDSHLYYFTNTSGSFVGEDLGHVGSYWTAIALDSDDKVHIACHYQPSQSVLYLNNVAGTWTSHVVATGIGPVWSVDIAVDSNARAHIVYEDVDDDVVRYHTNASGTWEQDVVNSTTVTEGGSCSIALDSFGSPHVVFASNGQLMHATRSGQDWNIARIDQIGDVAGSNDVAVDEVNQVHVVYNVYKSSISENSLYYAIGAGATWSNQLVAHAKPLVGYFNQVAIDSYGRPQVSYFNYISTGPNFETYLASYSTEWSSLLVAEPAYSPSIATGPGGALCILYLDDSVDELRYATTVLEAPSPPSAPLSLNAVGGVGYVDLTWSAPTDDGGAPVTGYKVYRSQTSGSYGSSPIATVTIGSYEDSAVTNGQKYYYTIKAVNAAGEGPNSSETSATPHELGQAPGKVTNLNAAWSGTYVTLTWTAPADGGSPLLGYIIFRSQQAGTPGPGDVPLHELGPGNTTYLDYSAVSNQNYYYWVGAWNDVGSGALSDAASTAPPSSGGLDIVLVAVISVVVIAMVAVAVLFLLRKR
jgi:hypothetical protein